MSLNRGGKRGNTPETARKPSAQRNRWNPKSNGIRNMADVGKNPAGYKPYIRPDLVVEIGPDVRLISGQICAYIRHVSNPLTFRISPIPLGARFPYCFRSVSLSHLYLNSCNSVVSSQTSFLLSQLSPLLLSFCYYGSTLTRSRGNPDSPNLWFGLHPT